MMAPTPAKTSTMRACARRKRLHRQRRRSPWLPSGQRILATLADLAGLLGLLTWTAASVYLLGLLPV